MLYTPSNCTLRYCLVAQATTAFDQLLQPLREARSWGTIDNIMIKADGHVQILTGFYPALKDTWFLGDAAQS
jgi:hypothetical protein